MNRPSGQDWKALFDLAGTGMNECGWGWDPEYTREYPGWDADEFRDAMRRCEAYLKELGAFD